MPHIFISYAKKDTRTLAETLFQALNDLSGVTAWMDMSLEADSSWASQIQSEIDRCDYMIVLLSPDVNRPIKTGQRRSFVLNEIDYAQQEDKTILPVMAQMTRMPVQLAGIQYIDLTRTSEDPGLIVQRVCARFGIKHTAPVIPTPSRPHLIRPMTIVAGIAGLIATFLLIVSLQSILFPPITPIPTATVQTDVLALTDYSTLASQEIAQAVTITEIPSWTPTDEPSSILSPVPTLTDPPSPTDTPAPTHTSTSTHTNTPIFVPPTLTISVQSLTTQAPTATRTLTELHTVKSTREPTMTLSAPTVVDFPCQATVIGSESQVLNVVRSSPSDSSPAIISVVPNEPVLVLGIHQQNTRTFWYQIARSGTEALGWIAPRYLALSDLCPS